MIKKNLIFTPPPELCGVKPLEVAGDELLGVVRVSNTPVSFRRVFLATCLVEGSLALRENLAKFFSLYRFFFNSLKSRVNQYKKTSTSFFFVFPFTRSKLPSLAWFYMFSK